MRHRLLLIGSPRLYQTQTGLKRVTSRVGGHDVFFESTTLMTPSPEAFATAFLFPAMSLGMDLKMEDPVCPVWLRNMKDAQAIANWPLARQNLRICWEFRNENLNCRVCEKCLRTRLDFMAVGAADPLPPLPKSSLIDHLDRIPNIPPSLHLEFKSLYERIPDPGIKMAITKLRKRGWLKKHLRPRLALNYKRLKRRLTKIVGSG